MSRSHMLYNDSQINKITNINWTSGKWKENDVFKFDHGRGFTIEGIVLGTSRIAVSDQTSKLNQRYTCLQLLFKKAFRRTFSANGEEVEQSHKGTKIVNTGYLMSSYQTVSTADNNIVNITEVTQEITIPQLNASIAEQFKAPNSILLFYSESSFADIEVNADDYLRIKTKGNGPYIESMFKIDKGHVSSSKHDVKSDSKGQSSWTDKIMSMKDSTSDNTDQTDGVDDGEWDD